MPAGQRRTTNRNSEHDHTADRSQLEGCAIALRELVLASERLRLVTAQHLGLSLVDSLAISYVRSGGPQGQQELATSLSMTTGSVTSLIDRLVARGLVERTPHPSDRRRTIIRITDDGNTRLAQAEGWMTEAFQHVESLDYVSTAHTLRAISDGLDASSETILARSDASTDPSRLR